MRRDPKANSRFEAAIQKRIQRPRRIRREWRRCIFVARGEEFAGELPVARRSEKFTHSRAHVGAPIVALALFNGIHSRHCLSFA